MRLIDADDLMKKAHNIEVKQYPDGAIYRHRCIDILDLIDAPTILVDNYAMGYQDGVRTVLKEVKDGKYDKQGEWIPKEDKFVPFERPRNTSAPTIASSRV